MDRRFFLRNSALGSAALFTGCASVNTVYDPSEPDAEGEFHFAHLTDMHVQKRRNGDAGYRACIADVNSLTPRMNFVIMGGDGPFDGCYRPKEEFAENIDLFKNISDELHCPWYNCIGNHDVLGLDRNRKVPIDDPDMGRKFMMDRIGMKQPYYSFDHGGWHFVVLNCIFEKELDHGPGYESRIGEEQLHWLAKDLGRANRPSMVVTHIAALTTYNQIQGAEEAKAINGGVCVLDTKDLREVLERHKVKAVLQGHLHSAEDHLFRGVWYISSDAVSSCWWSGTWNGQPYGYTTFRCRPNGQFTWQRRAFEWETTLDPADELERERTAEWEEYRLKQAQLAAEEGSTDLLRQEPSPADASSSGRPARRAVRAARPRRARSA